MTVQSPILAKDLHARVGRAGQLGSVQTFLPMATLTVAKGERLTLERDRTDDNLLRVCCEVGPNGMEQHSRKDIEAIRVDEEMAKRFADVRELKGFVPDDVERPSVNPRKAERTRAQKYLDIDKGEGKGDREDRGATIFGTDDRYLFNDRSFPWRTTGVIRTAGGACTGTMIGPRLVLTASHCINWSSDGSSAGWITFTPGSFDGDAPWGTYSVQRIIYWQPALGLLSDHETAFDYVILVLEESLGNTIGYPGYRTYDDDWNDGRFWQIIGYPGELASGQRPGFQGDASITSVQTHGLSGQTGAVLGHFNDITPGQSGGPCWGWWDGEPWPRVVGVVSTIGSTAVQAPHGSTNGDNEFGGGPALSALISWARSTYP